MNQYPDSRIFASTPAFPFPSGYSGLIVGCSFPVTVAGPCQTCTGFLDFVTLFVFKAKG